MNYKSNNFKTFSSFSYNNISKHCYCHQISKYSKISIYNYLNTAFSIL